MRYHIITGLALFIALGLGQGMAQEPSSGSLSRPFLVTSIEDLRSPPPPDEAATAAEIGELKTLAAQRDAATLDQIAFWDTGGPVYRWNDIAAAEMIDRGIPTPLAGRNMALLHVAIHDAILAAAESKAAYQRPRPSDLDKTITAARPVPEGPSYPSEHAAVAGAASEVLAYLLPDKAAEFRRMAEEAAQSRVLAGVAFPSDVTAGLDLGREVGARIVARGQADGSDAKWTGAVPTGPGMWNGTNPALPLAGTWKPWVLTSGDALRPPPPPAYDSPQMKAELDELRHLELTPAMLSKAWFWEWGAGPFRGWHFWNEQTSRKVLEYGLADKPLEAARVFALESIAFHDALVACWDAKYAYWAMRPSQLDPELKPLFALPNHPSYPSAHACLSTAAGHTLAALFPRDAEKLRAFSAEAAEARIWAGIHSRSDAVAGQAIGEAVAEKVKAFASRH